MDCEKELREYMQQKYGGLRDDRSTASYALEFLKTAEANHEQASKRVMAEIHLQGLEKQLKYIKAAIADLYVCVKHGEIAQEKLEEDVRSIRNG